MDSLPKLLGKPKNIKISSDLHSNDAFRYIWINWQFLGMKPTLQYKYLYYIYAVVFNIIGPLMSPVPLIAYLFMEAPNLLAIITTVPPVITLFISSLKQYTIWIMKNRLLNCKPILDELDARAKSDEQKYLKQTIKTVHIIYWTYTALYCLTFIVWISVGILLKRYPFDAWYPFDYHNKYFVHGYIYQVLSLSFALIQQVSNDAYPLSYISIITAHMHALRMRIQKIDIPRKNDMEKNYQDLSKCIRDHKNINNLINQICPVISATIFIQFTVTAIIVCTTSFGMLISTNTGMQNIASIFLLGAVISEMLPVCYFASKLIEETENLRSSIFDCNWIGQSLKFQKNIITFMQRTQLSNVILAGNIFPITLPTVVQIFKFSISLFALINQVGK